MKGAVLLHFRMNEQRRDPAAGDREQPPAKTTAAATTVTQVTASDTELHREGLAGCITQGSDAAGPRFVSTVPPDAAPDAALRKGKRAYDMPLDVPSQLGPFTRWGLPNSEDPRDRCRVGENP